MRKPNQKYFDNPEKYIPKGFYCYGKGKVCPFWDMNDDVHYQESGYCHYLEKGDWMEEGTSLLWDQVKECGINEYTEEEINDMLNEEDSRNMFNEGE